MGVSTSEYGACRTGKVVPLSTGAVSTTGPVAQRRHSKQSFPQQPVSSPCSHRSPSLASSWQAAVLSAHEASSRAAGSGLSQCEDCCACPLSSQGAKEPHNFEGAAMEMRANDACASSMHPMKVIRSAVHIEPSVWKRCIIVPIYPFPCRSASPDALPRGGPGPGEQQVAAAGNPVGGCYLP